MAILRGRDYEKRGELMKMLSAENKLHTKLEEPVIASGISEFIPGQDETVMTVFGRADSAMYENKKVLKGE